MRLLDGLTSAMGRPEALRTVVRGGRTVAAIGRWRHAGTCVDRTAADAVQLVFNVTGGQLVELRWPDRCVRGPAVAGSAVVVSPAGPACVAVTGAADAVHVLLDPDWVDDAVTGGPASAGSPPPLGLQALGARALVALSGSQGGTRAGDDVLDGIVRRAADLLRWHPAGPPAARRGGLAPAAARRVRAFVDDRLEADWSSPPSLGELAAVAGLSAGHFAKAFRESEGQTPYASVNARRISRAVSMLVRPDARVDRLSHQLGFCSPAHFVSAFRRLVGVTPGAVRDAARADA